MNQEAGAEGWEGGETAKTGGVCIFFPLPLPLSCSLLTKTGKRFCFLCWDHMNINQYQSEEHREDLLGAHKIGSSTGR